MKNNIIAFARTQELLKQVGKTHEEYLKIITDICEYEVSVYKTPIPKVGIEVKAASDECLAKSVAVT